MEDNNTQMEGLKKIYESLQQQISRNPNSFFLYSQLGSICVEMGNRKDALIHFKKALTLNPQNKEVKEKMRTFFSYEETKDILKAFEPPPFWKDIGWTLAYPLDKEGKVMIIAGAVIFGI